MSLASTAHRYDRPIQTDPKRIPWISSSTGLPVAVRVANQPRYRDHRPHAPQRPFFDSNRRDDRGRPPPPSRNSERDRERERDRHMDDRMRNSRAGPPPRRSDTRRDDQYHRRRGNSKSPSPTPEAREHSRLVAEEQRMAVRSRPVQPLRSPSPVSTRQPPSFDFQRAASLRREASEPKIFQEPFFSDTIAVIMDSPPPIGNSPPPPLALFHPDHMQPGRNDIFSQSGDFPVLCSEDVANVHTVDSAPAWAELQVYGSNIDEELCYHNDEEIVTYADGTMVIYYQVKRDTNSDNPSFWANRAVYYNSAKLVVETRLDIHFTAGDMGPGHVLFSGLG